MRPVQAPVPIGGGEDTTVVIVMMLEYIVKVSIIAELLSLGDAGINNFVCYREVVHTSEVKNV